MTSTALCRAHDAATDHPRYLERLSSVGLAHTVVEVKVADPDDRELPVGETGEVLVRGDSVMLGYWSDREATTATLRGGGLPPRDLGACAADGGRTMTDRWKYSDVISGR